MSGKKGKKRTGIVYSTDPDFNYKEEAQEEQDTLPPAQQDLRVMVDRKQRKGKTVTLVKGFVGTAQDLKDLGKLLKSGCGVGGTVKEGQILIQGEMHQKVMEILKNRGYKVKKSGG